MGSSSQAFTFDWSKAGTPAPAAAPSTRAAGAVSAAATDSFLSPERIYYREDFFFQDMARDQWTIWRSPASLEKGDLRWILPLAAGTGVLISTDDRTSEWLADLDFPSSAISALGGPTNFLTAGAVYGLGRWTGNPRLAETGLLGLRATGSTWMLVQAVKQGTNRERPDKVEGEGDFWHGGTSFPSGHSASTWALATVVAERYPERKLLRFSMYALAGSVSFARLSGERHFPSDVLIGAVVGHLIGRHVVKDWRSRRELLQRSGPSHPLP